MNKLLTHLNQEMKNPSRVVILGGKGFIGTEVTKRLMELNSNVLSLGRKELDLLSDKSVEILSEYLNPEDSLLVISAEAPVKNNMMLERNIKIASNICEAINIVKPNHMIYVSSDAVYADTKELINEKSCAQPTSLHGVMHLTRETMLVNHFSGPLGIIRPTLIYGLKDPHNGYGPNRFRRLAIKGEDVVLFGDGEELRDHIFIDDVVKLIVNMLLHRSKGILNAATGNVITFFELAEIIVSRFSNNSRILCTERSGLIPHNGYRAFNSSNTFKAFPEFTYTDIREWIQEN